MKIQNSPTQVQESVYLNDKDYFLRLQSTLKEMTKNYATALTEASNNKLYKKIKDQFETITALQRKIYDVMFENGWYQLETAGKTELSSKHDMLNKEYQSLDITEDDDEDGEN